jgi:hypothetical protein
MATYRVQITNPTDTDASVQDCAVAPPVAGLTRLPVQGIAGLEIPGQAKRTVTATFQMPIGLSQVKALAGHGLACTGIDWHGNPPI